MNFSDTERTACAYLGYLGAPPDERTRRLISECLAQLEGLGGFKYKYRIFDRPPEFAQKEPYRSFLAGCSAVVVSVCTLGAAADKRLKYLEKADMEKAVVFDACASAYLEHLADEFEKGLGENPTYRFCPGYGGSDLGDTRYIFEIVRPEDIGVTRLDSGLMVPQKSMAGIVGLGAGAARAKKTCDGCVNRGSCAYLKEGATCFTEKK